MKAPDQIDITQRTLGQALANPLTWAPFLPIAGAYAFIGAPWWVCLPAAVIAAGVVSAAWARRWGALSEQTRVAALIDFRRDENAALEERIQRLSAAPRTVAGRPPVLPARVQALREAVAIKRAVEERLFADGAVVPHEAEVGQMIADLARTMVEETERMHLAQAQPGGSPGGRGGQPAATAVDPARFDQAARTLRQSFQDLDVILDPVPPSMKLPQEENDALAQARERLEERIKQAHGVRRLMEERLPSPDDLQPPAAATPPAAGPADRRRPQAES